MISSRRLAVAGSALALGFVAGAAHAQVALQGEGSSLATPTYNAEFAAFPDTAHYTLQEYSTSSGKGQAAVTNNVGTVPPSGNGVPAGEAVDWGASDSFVSSTFQSTWNSAATGLPEAGPFIQIPMLGIAIAIPFQDATIKSGAKLQLTDSDLCNVFSGAVTNWSGVPSAASQGASGTITVFYRADSSGTSFLFSQHLGAVCGTTPLGPDNVVFHATTAFASQFPFYTTDQSGNTFVPGNLLPNFTAEIGSSGIATGLGAAAEGIAYLSPDYTDLNPHSNSGFTTLKAADVVNASNGVAYSASAKNTATGLQHPGAGSTNGSPPKGKTNAENQLNWVPSIPVTTSGYPIVGYTNWLIPQCFADTSVGSGLIEFLTDHFAGDFKTQIGNNGFVAMQVSSYIKAIQADFIGNSSKFNLDIDDSKVCNTSGKSGTYAGRPNHSGS
jgi:ABC-type phosphate transport system substrate-binding protein